LAEELKISRTINTPEGKGGGLKASLFLSEPLPEEHFVFLKKIQIALPHPTLVISTNLYAYTSLFGLILFYRGNKLTGLNFYMAFTNIEAKEAAVNFGLVARCRATVYFRDWRLG
jgi:hypothetical protein